MNDARFKMILTYFDIKSRSRDSVSTIYEYRSKSTKINYYFKISNDLVHEFRMSEVISDELDNLIVSLICIIRDERTSNIRKV